MRRALERGAVKLGKINRGIENWYSFVIMKLNIKIKKIKKIWRREKNDKIINY